jgi:hypothetical protein
MTQIPADCLIDLLRRNLRIKSLELISQFIFAHSCRREEPESLANPEVPTHDFGGHE